MFLLSLIYQTRRKAQNHNQMTNNTTINWKSDSLEIIRAKQQLEKFLQEQNELKGRYPKVDEYHNRRIAELNAIIDNN